MPLLPVRPVVCLLSAGLVASGMTAAAGAGTAEASQAAIERIRAETGGTATVRLHRATGTARLLRLAPDSTALARPDKAAAVEARAAVALEQFGDAFGVRRPGAELSLDDVRRDRLGRSRVAYRQVHRGVPVFGARLHVHFDAEGRLATINGAFVPDLDGLDPRPHVDGATAGSIAVRDVTGRRLPGGSLAAAATRLVVYRTHLARGGDGTVHLAWEVEVSGHPAVREFVYVDAHKGSVVDRITGIHDALDQRVYDGGFAPEFLVWSTGDAFPTADADIDNLVSFSDDTYNLFSGLSGGSYLSFDGADAIMHSVNNSPAIGCPNAAWNGVHTLYCSGVTGDDTVAHEWGHAYTEFTHGLIYQWQPGALNESYSDIYGEIVDVLNGDGTDSPVPLRGVGECSTLGRGPGPRFEVQTPAAVAGNYFAAGAGFNPDPPLAVGGTLEVAFDGDDADGCQGFSGFTAGNVALVDRGNCPFTTKVLNAQSAGAVAAVVVNSAEGAFTMGGSAGGITIPSVMIGNSDGAALRNAAGPVSVTLALEAATEASWRWLAAEDDPSFGGAIRDMWTPTCYGDPGKVSDPEYQCSSGDSGGVHTNSGVPNHAFALLIDGGTYNGHTVTPISLTVATAIYWRAQTVYQTPTSDFAAHADALELSCQDLLGAPLFELSTDTPTPAVASETVTAADCAALAEAIAAVELRREPIQCGFEPLLASPAPPVCGTDVPVTIAGQDFESGLGDWTVGTRAVVDPATFDTPDWSVVGTLPSGRDGNAAFVPDLRIGNCQDDTEAGVLFLESPDIVIPSGIDTPRLAFELWVSTERGWDGGNVKLAVNGAAPVLIPAEAFTFNPYPSAINEGDNPLSGEPAYTGTDGGSLGGSWAQSQIDLTSLAGPGDTIRVRFEMGLDGCNGVIGWYVDDVSVFSCAACAASDWFEDADGDGFGNAAVTVAACSPPSGFVAQAGDCDDTAPTAWDAPGEATGLRFSDPATLTWDAPASPGGNAVFYDVLRASSAIGFLTGGVCAETGSADLSHDAAGDPASEEVWHFLVRADNACPGSGPLGESSAGNDRQAPSCP